MTESHSDHHVSCRHSAAARVSFVLCTLLFAAHARSDSEPEKDPRAMATLDRMAAYLQSVPAFSVQANVTRDEVVHGDFKLQRAGEVRVSVQRPNRMRADQSGDQGERLFVYDGKALNVFAKSENYYASVPAPPTVLATLDAAIDEHGVELPLLDVVYVAMGGKLRKAISAAGYIGKVRVEGSECEHVAFRSERVDFQLWVQQGSQAVPRKLVVTTRDAPTFPQYSAVMRWEVAPKFSEQTFRFSPPAGALPMRLGPPGGDLSQEKE